MFTVQNYAKPETLEEAYELNQKKTNKIIAGMLWSKMQKGNVQTAIDLSKLGLDQIEETEDEFRIGCMTTLRTLELHEGFKNYTWGASREALKDIVGVQFRNLATVGGSLYGRYGFSDVLTLFLAMDTMIELYKGGMIPLSEYANRKQDRDILVRVIVKKKRIKMNYQSVRNQRTDFPVLTCCALTDLDSHEYRFSIGARPGKAVLLTDEGKLLEGEITEEKAEQYAAFAKASVKTGSNMRASAEYRSHLTEVLVKRAIMRLGGLSDAD